MNKKFDVSHVASKLAARKVAGLKVASKSEDMPEDKKCEGADNTEEKSEDMPSDAPAEDSLSDADFSGKAREMLGASDNEEALGLLAAALESLKSVQEQAEMSEEEEKKSEVEKVVEEAMKAGRLTPAQRASSIELGMFSLRALKTQLASAAVRVQTVAYRESVAPVLRERAGIALTAEEIRHGKMAGFTEAQLLATKAKLEARAQK